MRRLLFLILFATCMLQQALAQVTQNLWVGQSYTCDGTSAMMGLTSDKSWTTSGGYFSLSGSGSYRTVTISQYFSGTASVTFSWKERLTANSQWKSRSKTWYFTCRDNQVYITPSSMILSVGESDYVGYSHQYDNSYTYAANAYFSSSNPTIASVNEHTGEVIARSPGTTYINVYSKISSNTPYCKVTVREVDVESVSIPNSVSIIAGETKQLSTTVYPSNGTVKSISWHTNNTSIATVSSSGVLTAVKHGTAKVYCIVNNSIKSNEATVIVSKSTLKISASNESGLLKKGTAVSLSASDANAKIYYTIDGSIPTENSTQYKNPIIIDRNLTLKAIACHKDYNTSEVLVRNFNVTSLEIEKIYPDNDTEDIGIHTVPHVCFNNDIYASENINKICLKKGDELIDGKVILSDSTVYFVPVDYLEKGISYTFYIPQNSICTSTFETHEDIVVSFSTGKFPISVAAGHDMAAVLMSDGSLWTWGGNGALAGCRLGDGTTGSSLSPVKILEDVRKVDLGDRHGVALKNDNTLWTWGINSSGQLGDGTYETRLSPVKIMDNVIDVSANYDGTAIIKSDNTLWMCGNNYYGQIGNGTTSSQSTPVNVLNNVKCASVGDNHSAAVTTDGILYTWGSNYRGQLGGWPISGSTDTGTKKPFKTELGNIQMVACGNRHTAAIDGIGALRTVGDNSDKQLGLAAGGYSNHFYRPESSGVTFVSAMEDNTAIIKNGNLYVCGENEYGLVKDGALYEGKTLTYRLSDVKLVDVGTDMIIALTNDGSVYTWGNNDYGQLGTGSDSPSRIYNPTKIMSGFSSAPLEKLTLPPFKNGYIGKDIVLVPDIIPYNAGFNTIKWQSSDESIATVSQRGIVTGVSEGEADITVTVESLESTTFETSCKVTIKKAITTTSRSGVYSVSYDELLAVDGYNYPWTPPTNFTITVDDDGTMCYISSIFGNDVAAFLGNRGLPFTYIDQNTAVAGDNNGYYFFCTDYQDAGYTIARPGNDNYLYLDVNISFDESGKIYFGDLYIIIYPYDSNTNSYLQGEAICVYRNLVATKVASSIDLPASSDTNVKCHVSGSSIILSEELFVQVYNATGGLVYTGSTSRVDNLSKGLYIVKMGDKTQKVLIR